MLLGIWKVLERLLILARMLDPEGSERVDYPKYYGRNNLRRILQEKGSRTMLLQTRRFGIWLTRKSGVSP